MLHIIPYHPDWRSDPTLCAMHAARKRVFVDLLGWSIPVFDHHYEVDQFDRPGATYLVLTDHAGAHRASARLLPTDRPHLLGSLFPDLCAEAPPAGPAIHEITRFCLDRGLRARERRRARDALVHALVAHALDLDITAYSAVADMAWFEQIRLFGWRCEALGRPRRHDNEELVALRIEIDAETPALLIAAGIDQACANRESRRAA
jgi:N-acyl-L-homoserine lactone synthetase